MNSAPVRDAVTAPFWEAVDRHELVVQRCDDCGQVVFYPRAHCPSCWSSALTWGPASGRGVVYSQTVVHRAYGDFADQAPYAVVLVDLDDGFRMMSRVLDGPVRIGERVEVAFTEVADGVVLPYFRPVS
jgi:uncharacterized protein